MRTLTVTYVFAGGGEAQGIHRGEFPDARMVPEWTGQVDRLPAELVSEDFSQAGFAGYAQNVARERGDTIRIDTEGDWMLLD